MKKILLFSVLTILILVSWSVKDAKTKDQPYYSGDAVLYYDHLIIASTNSGKLEFFKSSGDKVERLFSHSLAFNPSKQEVFNDVKLEVQGNKLVAYAIAGYTLYEYDVSDLKTARFEKKIRNTYWEWYHRIERLGKNLATISDRGVRIWNQNLDVIDGYDFISDSPYSLRSGGDNRFLFAIDNKSLKIYDRESRAVINKIALNFHDENNINRKAYYDRNNELLYIADDYYVKKYNLEGSLLTSFRHYNDSTYDTESAIGSKYIYVSSGSKIHQLSKSDLKLVREQKSFDATPQGWSMGLKLVSTKNGDRLVVFNNSGIAIFDQELKLLASSGKISQDDGITYPYENLYISLNFYSVKSGATITVNGGGYLPNEDVVISLKNTTKFIKADNFGRYVADLYIPQIQAGRYDVKADGKTSGLTYSTSLEVVQ